MTRVLVTGGRDYQDRAHVFATLDATHAVREIRCVIQGEAAGADALAKQWARAARVPTDDFPAQWREFGSSAGPIRNARMLEVGKPDLVVSFPGGRGTANMVKLARAAGVEVNEIAERGTDA